MTSTASGSLPGTPLSQRSASEVITNKLAMEGGSSENSQEDSEVKKVRREESREGEGG